MPTEIPILTAVPAVLNFAVKSFQTGYELKQVPQETRELFETIRSVRLDILKAKEKRITLAKTLNADDLAEWDRSIRETESALAGLERLVEPTRLDLQVNNGQIRAWTRLMWVVRDSQSLSATSDRLGFAHQRLLYSSLAATQMRQICRQSDIDHHMETPAPSYQDATKQAIRERRREHKQRTSRPGSIRAVGTTPVLAILNDPLVDLDEHSWSNHSTESNMLPTAPIQDGMSTPSSGLIDTQYLPVPLTGPIGPFLSNIEDEMQTHQAMSQATDFSRRTPVDLSYREPVFPSQGIRHGQNRAESPVSTASTRVSGRSSTRDTRTTESRNHISQDEHHLNPFSIAEDPNTLNRTYSFSSLPSRLSSTAGPSRVPPPSSRAQPDYHAVSPPSQYTTPGYQRSTRAPYNADDFDNTEYPAPIPSQQHDTPASHDTSSSSPPNNYDTTNNIANIQQSFPGYRNPVNIRWQPSPYSGTIASRGSQPCPSSIVSDPSDQTPSQTSRPPASGQYLAYRPRRSFRRLPNQLQVPGEVQIGDQGVPQPVESFGRTRRRD